MELLRKELDEHRENTQYSNRGNRKVVAKTITVAGPIPTAAPVKHRPSPPPLPPTGYVSRQQEKDDNLWKPEQLFRVAPAAWNTGQILESAQAIHVQGRPQRRACQPALAWDRSATRRGLDNVADRYENDE